MRREEVDPVCLFGKGGLERLKMFLAIIGSGVAIGLIKTKGSSHGL